MKVVLYETNQLILERGNAVFSDHLTLYAALPPYTVKSACSPINDRNVKNLISIYEPTYVKWSKYECSVV